MPDKAIYEMISAFAVGCMDKQNYMQFKDYIAEGGYLPKSELGELQNVISMIPVILELENPDPIIKDLVAKKLIGIKDEIKTKIMEGKKKSFTSSRTATSNFGLPDDKRSKSLSFIEKSNTRTPPTFQSSNVEEQEVSFTKKIKTANGQIKKPSEEKPKTGTRKEETKKSLEQPPMLTPARIPSYENEPERNVQPERMSAGAAGWISLLLSIILFSVLGYFTYTSLGSINTSIEDLKRDVSSLKNQINSVNSFVNNYASLVEFFNNKDIIVAYLNSSNPEEKASAKLLLSFNEKEGLVQFNNPRPLRQDQGYQIWVLSKGQPYSLGIYQPIGNEYLKISSFPFLPKERIDSYIVTIEAGSGASIPSTNIYLTSASAKPVTRN